MTIQYEPSDMTFFTLLSRWQGTMFPLVLSKKGFWFFVVLHTVFVVLQQVVHQTGGGTLPPIDFKIVTAVTGLLVFFLVFYGSQCYARLQMFFGHCVGLSGTGMNWMALLQTALPDGTDRATKWNCARFVLAAHHLLFYTLNSTQKVSDDEWKLVHDRALLSKTEKEQLTACKAYRPLILLVWALREVDLALGGKAANDPRTAAISAEFRQQAFDFRGHCGQITNWLKQPVPFPYFHVLSLFMLLDLVVVSYGLVTMDGLRWYAPPDQTRPDLT